MWPQLTILTFCENAWQKCWPIRTHHLQKRDFKTKTTVLHQGWQWAFHHTKNDPYSCEHNLCNCVSSPKKIQDFNRIWTHDLTIPVRCSNRLSYEATDVGSWSIMCSYVLVKEMNVIDVYETNHTRTAEMKSNEDWTSQLWTQFMQLRNKRKKKFRT